MPRIVRARDQKPNYTGNNAPEVTDTQLLLTAVSVRMCGLTACYRLLMMRGGVGGVAGPFCSDAPDTWSKIETSFPPSCKHNCYHPRIVKLYLNSTVDFQLALIQGATPTLAQRHGLVKAPPAVLSEQEWESMQAKSRDRQDSHHECCICREHFGLQEQALLSCSHVFHKQCILSFERYARIKAFMTKHNSCQAVPNLGILAPLNASCDQLWQTLRPVSPPQSAFAKFSCMCFMTLPYQPCFAGLHRLVAAHCAAQKRTRSGRCMMVCKHTSTGCLVVTPSACITVHEHHLHICIAHG